MDRYRYFIIPKRLGKHEEGEFVEYKEIEQLKNDVKQMANTCIQLRELLRTKGEEIERLTDISKAKGALIKAQAKK